MEKKKTGLIVLVVILSLLVLGLGGFVVYDKIFTKDSEPHLNETTNNEDNEENISSEISRESIVELSKNHELNINTNFDDIDKPITSDLYLSINENNKLILKYNDKYSIVSNLDEDVVMLYSANDSCQLETGTFLILTNIGNVYSYEKEYYKSEEYIKNINNEVTTNIPLIKLNGSSKVLAFTNYTRKDEVDSEPITCGGYPPVVYTEDDKFMEIIPLERTLKEYNF